MSPALQQQYLEAMGIQLWQPRFSVPDTVSQTTESALVTTDAEELLIQPDTVSAADVPVEQTIKSEPLQVPEVLGLTARIASCQACELHQQRQHTVVADGDEQARFMFVFIAPVMQLTDTVFLAGEASELFNKMINAIGLQRQQVYLTSLLKCPLENNRAARTTEMICCEDYLAEQIEQVKPELIIAMGETVAQHLLVSKQPLDVMRQKTYQYHNVPIVAMHHPDALLQQPELKRSAWQDLQKIQRDYNV